MLHYILMNQPSHRPRASRNSFAPEYYMSGFSGIASLKLDNKRRISFPKNNVPFEGQSCPQNASFVPVIFPEHPGVLFLFPPSFLNPTAALTPNGAEIHSAITLDSMQRLVIPVVAVQTLQISEDRTIFLAGKGPYCVLSTTRDVPHLDPQQLRTILHPVLLEKLFPQPAPNGTSMVPEDLAGFLEEKICALLGLQPGGTVTIAGVQVNVSLSVQIVVVPSNGEPS